MQTLVARNRAFVFTPRCSSQKENSITTLRKAFEAKRTQTAKNNLNKLIVIANNDIKECNEFLKELDTLHKEQFKSFFENSTPSPKNDTANSSTDENIFLN